MTAAEKIFEHGATALKAALALACVFLIAKFGLIHFGVLPPIKPNGPDLSAPGLIPTVLLHAAFGIVLFAGVITSGLALLSLAPHRWRFTPSDHALFSLLAGLVLWLLVSVAVRAVGGNGYLMLGVIFGLSAIRFRAISRNLTPDHGQPSCLSGGLSRTTLAFVLVFALCLSAYFGLLWRQPGPIPNGTLDLGDLSIYVANYHSIRFNALPMYSLGVEGEQFLPFNQIAAYLALAFDDVPGFDISFFLTSSLAIFFFLATAFSIAQIARYRRIAGRPPLDTATACIIILMLCAGTRYPSWIAESPPYAFAVPLALTLTYLADRGRERIGFLYALLPLTALAFAITKIVAIVPLGAYAICCLVGKAFSNRSRGSMTALFLGAAVIGGFAFFLLVTYGPAFLALSSAGDFGPPSLHLLQDKAPDLSRSILKRLLRYAGGVLPTLAMDIGLLLLPIGFWRLRSFPLLTGTAAGVGIYFIYPFLFHGAATSAFVLTAGWLLLDGHCHSRSTRLILTLAAALLLASHFFNDPGLSVFTLIWVATFGTALALILFQRPTPRIAPRRWPAAVAGLWLYLLPLALLIGAQAQAEGDLRYSVRYYGVNRQTVSPKLYDLWANVRDLTPHDALIFTDQTGTNPTRLEGWNDFSLIAERQFYISTWQASPLRGNPAALQDRLGSNLAVLKGSLRPEQLSLRRHYGSYFAAVSATFPAPADFQRIYDNGQYAIYRIP